MSSAEEVSKARKHLEEILNILINSDENLLGAMVVDIEEGLPLVFVIKATAFDVDVGPKGEEEEPLAGTIMESFEKIAELSGKDRLNIGSLMRVLIEGSKGISILQPFEKARAILLLYGSRGVKLGFVYTVLTELKDRLEELAKIALSGA